MTQTKTTTGMTICHPDWPKIREEIGALFDEKSDMYKWALDAVIAHQLGETFRSRRSLTMMGEDGANRLRAICRTYRIELPA